MTDLVDQVKTLREMMKEMQVRDRMKDAPDVPAAHAATIALAVDGATVGDLRATGATVDGVGIGHEELADGERLEPGIVCYIERWSDPVLVGDTVLVGEDSPKVLTTL